jgi:hypothetical protein
VPEDLSIDRGDRDEKERAYGHGAPSIPGRPVP